MTKVLNDKKFWAAIVALLVVLSSQFIPNFTLDEGGFVGLVIIVIGYMTGVALDANSAPGWRGIIGSRKFWGAMVGLVFMLVRAFNVQLGESVTPELMIGVCTALSGYIIMAGVEKTPPVK
jgi:hypothetical protein